MQALFNEGKVVEVEGVFVFEAVHTGTYLCSGKYRICTGIGTHICKAVLGPQQVQQKRHVFKFVKATVVVAGCSAQPRRKPKSAVIDPSYQFGFLNEFCIQLPGYKTSKRFQRMIFTERV